MATTRASVSASPVAVSGSRRLRSSRPSHGWRTASSPSSSAGRDARVRRRARRLPSDTATRRGTTASPAASATMRRTRNGIGVSTSVYPAHASGKRHDGERADTAYAEPADSRSSLADAAPSDAERGLALGRAAARAAHRAGRQSASRSRRRRASRPRVPRRRPRRLRAARRADDRARAPPHARPPAHRRRLARGTRASAGGSAATRTPTLVDLSWVGSTLAGGLVIPSLVGVLLLVFLLSRHWRLAAFTLFVICIESGAYRATTLVVHRDRPDVHRLESLPVNASYPSGHTAASVALFGGLLLVLASRVESLRARSCCGRSPSRSRPS